jgi:hypothetical protein
VDCSDGKPEPAGKRYDMLQPWTKVEE